MIRTRIGDTVREFEATMDRLAGAYSRVGA
jgi:hypothetical protein